MERVTYGVCVTVDDEDVRLLRKPRLEVRIVELTEIIHLSLLSACSPLDNK